MIPMLMRLKIVEEGKNKINLWLPLFLLWIILLAVMILLLPFILIAALVFWILRNDIRILLVYPRLYSVLRSLSGLAVQIEEENKKVFLIIQ